MPDVAYRSTDPNPEPAPAEPVVQLENLDSWRDHQRKEGQEVDGRLPEPGMSPQEFADAASRGSDDAAAREMSRELRRQREQQGRNWEDKAPIVQIKAGAESYKDVRAATRERTDTRELATKDALMRAGVSEDRADAAATRNRDRLLQAGVDKSVVDAIVDDRPTVAPMATEDGQPIDPETTFDNVYQATKALRNGRAVVEAARLAQEAEWQQQLSQYQEQAPAAEAVPAEQPAPTPQGPTPEQQQQAEVLAAQQYQLAHERAALTMTAEEKALHARDQAWNQYLARTPEATDWNAWQIPAQS